MTLADVPAALDLVRVGRALRSGGTTSVRVTEECLLAIATWNSALRAFITVSEERALDTAREADRELAAGYDRGPLHGIPISLKDIIDLAGTPTTAASDATSRDPVAADALVTRRLKAAGAVIVGKTNLHEFALGTTSDQSAYGTIRNPLGPDAIGGRVERRRRRLGRDAHGRRGHRHRHRRIDSHSRGRLRPRGFEAGLR